MAKEKEQSIAMPNLRRSTVVDGTSTPHLHLSTDKHDNGQIVSSVSVLYLTPTGGRQMLIGGDFRKVLKRAIARGTQKAIDTQHAEVFTPQAIETLKAEATEYYAVAYPKTRKEWNESGLDLGKFLQVGDYVDRSMVSYFVEVLPPATQLNDLLQMGEPHDHVNGQPTYATIYRDSKGWRYAGNCHQGLTGVAA